MKINQKFILFSIVAIIGAVIVFFVQCATPSEEAVFLLDRSPLYDTYATVYSHIKHGEVQSTSIEFRTTTDASITVHGNYEVYDSAGKEPHAVVYDSTLFRDARVELYVPEDGIRYLDVEAYTFS